MQINIPANGTEIRTTKDWVGVTCQREFVQVPAGAVIRINSMKFHRTYDRRNYDFVALTIRPRKGVAAKGLHYFTPASVNKIEYEDISDAVLA